VAALLESEFDATVTKTAVSSGGHFSVWVEGERIVNKFLIFKPSDEKILTAVRTAVG
jgi:hypothetical protein